MTSNPTFKSTMAQTVANNINYNYVRYEALPCGHVKCIVVKGAPCPYLNQDISEVILK